MSKKSRKVMVGVRLNPPIHRQLVSESEQRGLRLSDVIRETIERGLVANQQQMEVLKK